MALKFWEVYNKYKKHVKNISKAHHRPATNTVHQLQFTSPTVSICLLCFRICIFYVVIIYKAHRGKEMMYILRLNTKSGISIIEMVKNATKLFSPFSTMLLLLALLITTLDIIFLAMCVLIYASYWKQKMKIWNQNEQP